MSIQSNRPPHHDLHAIDHLPDFDRYRERAHQERTRAINHAMSLIWSRMTGRRTRRQKDAAFWLA